MQLEPLYAAEAKRRQVESGKFYGRGQEKVPPKLAEAKSDTRDKLSKIAGVSHGTLSKVKAIEKAAEAKKRQQLSQGRGKKGAPNLAQSRTLCKIWRRVRRFARGANKQASL